MSKTVQFKLEKLTPGALRYQEVDDAGNPRKTDMQGAVIGSLYLRKAQMEGKAPQNLTIIVND